MFPPFKLFDVFRVRPETIKTRENLKKGLNRRNTRETAATVDRRERKPGGESSESACVLDRWPNLRGDSEEVGPIQRPALERNAELMERIAGTRFFRLGYDRIHAKGATFLDEHLC